MSRTERDLLLELAGRARRRWREARDRGEREYWRLRFAQLAAAVAFIPVPYRETLPEADRAERKAS